MGLNFEDFSLFFWSIFPALTTRLWVPIINVLKLLFAWGLEEGSHVKGIKITQLGVLCYNHSSSSNVLQRGQAEKLYPHFEYRKGGHAISKAIHNITGTDEAVTTMSRSFIFSFVLA